jgi:Ca2+-binding RTX toxin-like protein
MSAGNYSDLFNALAKIESGDNYGFVSAPGYLGRYQFGEEALHAVGFYAGDGTSAIDFAGAWTGAAAAYGISDKASFLASAAGQDAAMRAWLVNIDGDLNMLDLGRFDGQVIGGVQITTSGLLMGAHLMGVWGLKDFLTSGGAIDPADWHGTTVSDYVSRFAGYDTPFAFDHGRAEAIAGGGGRDALYGQGGNDTLDGGGGDNLLRGGDGDDRLAGGAGFDDINGNTGADTAHGGAGDDWVVGGKDNDALFGDDGGDIVYGNLGADTVDGGAGADLVRGGQGNDVATGGAGDDWLSGDRGDDTLTGGAGADVFHSFAGAGTDLVTDFEPGHDRVMLDAGTAYSVAQEGADVVVHMAGAEVVLAGVSLASLPSGWIFEG